ncbi:MAG TPA: GNAT family N-acyltransferase [Sphingomicrobium sp.]|nr:GNAT family N-acyltransferase [Sphingomicrobium sp.]
MKLPNSRSESISRGQFAPPADPAAPEACAAVRIEVLPCRTEALLLEAKKLRYEVYCDELGRQSCNADHENRVLSDNLDQTGHTFIAREGGQTVGTVRVNFAWEGSISPYDELYDCDAWRRYQGRAAICTKLAVRSVSRSSDALLHLLAAALQLVIRNDASACFIDSLPRFTPLYARLGFIRTGEPFMHHENGLSDRLVLELVRYRGLIPSDDTLGGLRRLLRNAQAATR